MSPRFSRRAVVLAFVAGAAVLGCGALGGCTDGATPNCSDAAAGCSPDLDGTVDDSNVDEGGPRRDATAGDAPIDVAQDSAPAEDVSSDGSTALDADGG